MPISSMRALSPVPFTCELLASDRCGWSSERVAPVVKECAVAVYWMGFLCLLASASISLVTLCASASVCPVSHYSHRLALLPRSSDPRCTPRCITFIIPRPRSDAPALSNAAEVAPLSSSVNNESKQVEGATHPDGDAAGNGGAGEWDDAALAAATTSRAVTGASSELGSLTIQSQDYSGSGSNPYIDPDNIAEKLRVEETKAALAAAREGMEREAAKIKEEKLKKEQEAADKAAGVATTTASSSATPRFGAAAAGGMGGAGGKWVPPHMRGGSAGGGTMGSLRSRMMGGGGGKLDVADEELFPDLASADKILEQKEAESKKKTKPITVTTGATWASKMAAKKKEREAAAAPVQVEEKKPAPAPVPAPKVEEKPAPAPAAAAAPAPAPEAAKVTKKVVTKKKKKDLSTFKPST